jgi:Coenzyme PQQ synthesis protein D (PqqD)
MTLLKLRQADVHWREIDGEVIALETRASRYVATNGTGTILWRALLAGTTREGLADELVREYGIERERAVADADRFLDTLVELDLLAA